MKARHLIAEAVIKCIASGRDPTVHELFQVAEHFWSDSEEASIFSWSELPADGLDRLAALRAAKAALCGSDDLAELTASAAGGLRPSHRAEA